jgi:hypothetical protein
MNNEPPIYMVTKEQVGASDINEFLRNAIDREFSGSDYMIGTELIRETITHYSKTPRKLKGFSIITGGRNITIYFDITDVTQVDLNRHSYKMYQ